MELFRILRELKSDGLHHPRGRNIGKERGYLLGRVKFNQKIEIKSINISPLLFLKIFALRKKCHPPF
jgi:hypothetical protein